VRTTSTGASLEERCNQHLKDEQTNINNNHRVSFLGKKCVVKVRSICVRLVHFLGKKEAVAQRYPFCTRSTAKLRVSWSIIIYFCTRGTDPTKTSHFFGPAVCSEVLSFEE
jgi:hypothetical protein